MTLPKIKQDVLDRLRRWAEFEKEGPPESREQGEAIEMMLNWYDAWLASETSLGRQVRELLDELKRWDRFQFGGTREFQHGVNRMKEVIIDRLEKMLPPQKPEVQPSTQSKPS